MVLGLRFVLIAAFVFTAGAPLLVFWVWPRTEILNAEVDEVHERHLLIAENLGSALETYHRDMVLAFGSFARPIAEGTAEEARTLFENLYFRHICVADPATGKVLVSYLATEHRCPDKVPGERLEGFLELARGGGVRVSNVMAPEGERPRIYLVTNAGDVLVIGAIHTTFFHQLQERISFGRKGHAAIVDGSGRALAHPLATWEDEARDLSAISAVQRLMMGESGVETFHSPAMNEAMIAGFSAVPGAGWGVLVPQPLSELEAVATRINRDTLLILLAGLGLSYAIALWISSKIARRVTRVEYAAMAVAAGDRGTRVEETETSVRIRELSNLICSFNRMARGIEMARAAEERLQKTQKMEALGQLTGGIAHDFNNLLQVIQGNAEILNEGRGTDRNLTEPILEATELGGKLTHQLLAFSRLQPLRPEAFDPREMVSGISSLLTRTLGAAIEIELRTPPDLWPALADPNQLQNALLNLALNARDAISGHGRIVFTCENRRIAPDAARRFEDFAPGDYVVISVADNGSGMSDAVRARAFEPFFTTKATGQGSGLGLSMVYGFAKQSGGHATIESAPERGTTVSLFLRRAGAAAEPRPPTRDEPVPMGNGEVVLVVEDMLGVRTTSTRLLRDIGYRVIAVADAGAALRILRSGGTVDAVLCDVVLPGGVSGPEFVRVARRVRPDLKVVFMTGYSADTEGVADALASVNILLQKPFQRQDVARVLRDVLAPDDPPVVEAVAAEENRSVP